jgi:hypothetical protein
MIVILDTDHLTVIQRKTEPGYSNLRGRLQAIPERNVQATIISFEEQMRGWLSLISKAKNSREEVAAYKRLRALRESLATFQCSTMTKRRRGSLLCCEGCACQWAPWI